ncbi:DEAD/DEAH box helicase [Paenibacillus cremeus]|uniref:Helicase SNF n=1 Tax=Paenibacillus cremeus TaxID=2163881 RepID=A0A559K7N3_9BACL|nr:DEAD/DEAH box helicase [Paenibacillus cremeus]TVY08139.1 helicase SNF [Paenibacillus cremeus]
MSFQLTERVIKLLCGPLAYTQGEAYYRENKVQISHVDPDETLYTATVQGSRLHRVQVDIDSNGDVFPDCTCPAYQSSERNCKHIAAVLLAIHDRLHDGDAPVRSYAGSSRDGFDTGTLVRRYGGASAKALREAAQTELMDSVLELFDERPQRAIGTRTLIDSRTPLEVEFTCKPMSYGYRRLMFAIELKVGPKRLYIVQKIRAFLEQLDRGEAFVFSKHFTYDPKLHRFRPEQEAILKQLIQVYANEKLYREAASGYSSAASSGGGERLLLLPPAAWDVLLPLLAAAPSVRFEQDSVTYEGLRVSDEPLPLQFEFDEAASDSCRLEVQGLEQLTVMEPYGMVIAEGKLVRLPPAECKRLAELKLTLEEYGQRHLRISAEHVEPFMEKVIPGLMKLGNVRIAQAVSERIVHTPLQAKLYLDRVRDRLLAGLEFHYGDIVIQPLDTASRKRSEGRILMRDGEQEQRILELMEQAGFAQTEGGYFTEDEEAEYTFLYHIVPQLEKLVSVYATSAVKIRLFTEHAPVKVNVDVDERTDWLEFKFDMTGIPEADIRQLLKSLEEKRRYYRLPNGALLPLESKEFQELVRFMNEVGIRQADLKGSQLRLPAVRGLHLMDAEQELRQGHTVKLGKSLRQLLDNMRNPDNLDFPVPNPLASVLRDYQKLGYQWLKTLAHYRFGGILADDMGLGKTLQSIAFLVSVLPEIRESQQPALIVSPASLVYNWRNELAKFAPDVRAVIADGSREERSGKLKALNEAQPPDVIITSYPLLRRDIDLYVESTFHTLILDEAQVFKNYTTQTAQAVKELQARYRFALTGTPVENALEELWSIFDAVFPELFSGRKAFQELSREAVAKRARPFLLRRVKSDVLKELPEKIETLQAAELLPEQKKLYVAYLAQLRQETLKHLNEEGLQKHRIKILAGLTRLRQLCCHPALFVEGYRGGSAKFEQLMDIVEECRSAGKRMLVFSQFTEMLGLIGRELGLRGVPHFYLDGQTPAAERVELCSRFNAGERDLFLISLKAGGTGLNLTGADTVLLYDLWWNPAVEQQAADRAHRIGQKNVVQVIRLVAQGTVEEKMFALQQRKKNLIEEVIQPGHEALSSLTEQDIRELLMI